jgi:hypothetical protein
MNSRFSGFNRGGTIRHQHKPLKRLGAKCLSTPG